ncbi:MAG TPA: M20 family metallo-hydrolase [Bacteroidia bacterium]|jgi:acetylornithine deacetylase|nr:M20 family metallo-hydrolase [Bacteroidia bacterium]
MQGLISTTEEINSVLKIEVIDLLKQLIAIPSFSREENKTADLLESFLNGKGIVTNRKVNNIWSVNKHFNSALPTILLNSHHDTVKPDSAYTKNPFNPDITDGKLFGLGSNDAGGALVSLLATFLHYYENKKLKYNLIFCAGAEEEISGANGTASVLTELPEINFAIVAEPTQMNLAIAEKGLVVLDCISYGKSGHAAREEGENAIYKAIKDIEWFKSFSFPKISETLGPVKMNVTVIKAGSQHNVIPANCEFTVDVRTTDSYTNEKVLEIIKQNVSCEVKVRSLRLQPSSIPANHSFVQAGIKHGRKTYGSPTLSDQALMPWPSVKIGPGDSARSHSADEFIYINEIEEGIELYIKLLNEIVF